MPVSDKLPGRGSMSSQREQLLIHRGLSADGEHVDEIDDLIPERLRSAPRHGQLLLRRLTGKLNRYPLSI
jgi:hypothetical protein